LNCSNWGDYKKQGDKARNNWQWRQGKNFAGKGQAYHGSTQLMVSSMPSLQAAGP